LLETGFCAETAEDLFKKVFGQEQVSKQVSVDVTLKDYFLGSLTVWVRGNEIQKVSGTELNLLLANKIRDNKKSLYLFPSQDIPVSSLPFKLIYSAAELKLTLLISDLDLAPLNSALFDDLIPYYAKNATPPAPLAFGTNYKVEKTFGKNVNSPDFIEGQTDSFLNLKHVVLENQMHYLTTQKSPWYRQSSKFSYDFERRMERLEMGDISYPVIGYQQARPMGGFSFYRDFSLNPYRRSAPTSTFEYEILSRSMVKTYINGALIKSEFMNSGHYSVKDVPLNNGLNKILIEVTDEFDKKKVFIFNEAGSFDLLAPELTRYGVAAGLPSTDTDISKKYDQQNGPLVTGFFQQGINKNWTLGGYLQGNRQYSLLGSNNILATNYGNFLLDLVGTQNKFHQGEVLTATYQRNLFGVYWYSAHTFTTRAEFRTPWFNEAGENRQNRFDLSTSASYTIPLFEKFNLSLTGLYQNPTLAPNPKLSYEASLTANIFHSNSLSFFMGRSRDENKVWSTQLYCFLNISFADQDTFASMFYENQSQTKRLSVIRDSGKKVQDLKVSASAEDNKLARNGSLDLQYNANLADVGIREEISTVKNGLQSSKTSLRFLSAFALVYDNQNFAFSLSRPIANSFVIFKPANNFKGQRFGTEDDSESGLFGESLLSGLTPYQYKRLQLNPTHLEPGHYLNQESYVLFPRFRSGHLFVVGKDSLFVLKGTILDNKKIPLPLKVGFFTTLDHKSLPFFTNREGEFYIEGTSSTKGVIQIDDNLYAPFALTVDSSKQGIVELGNISLTLKENL
jgi:outer membrane usher protein FimD/PapC